jgi:hypothetical protein
VRLRQHVTVPMLAKPAAPAVDPALEGMLDPLPAVPPPLPSGGSDASAAEAPGTVVFSDKFHLDGGKNVAFALSANVDNTWLSAALDLVNDDTGAVVSVEAQIEYYAGVDDGESWSEGSRTASEVIGPVEAGNYVLRVEAQHGGLGDVDLGIELRQGVFRWTWFWIGLGVLAVPFGLVGLHAARFRRRRWENSDLGGGSRSFLTMTISGGDDD